MHTARAALAFLLALASTRTGEFVPDAGDDLVDVKYDSLAEEIRAGAPRNLTPAILGGQWVPLYSRWTKRPGAGRELKE